MAAHANDQFRLIEAIGAPAVLDRWMRSGNVDPLTELGTFIDWCHRRWRPTLTTRHHF
jgi:hypothetical protein